VPKDAVVRQADDQLVFVVQDNTARQVRIKTGHPYNGFIEVLDGALSAGDTVVVTGNENLRDQSKVVPRQTSPH
jgi:multidrug efflux pump subunit AcrA (membrane-fusion protein)